MTQPLVDTAWILICACLVFAMQGGFLCLESGVTRSKNAINVAVKNVTDFSVSFLLFWAFGFALMFGASQAGWIGGSHFLFPVSTVEPKLAAIFLFQAMFCATAATIVSGAVAERTRFWAYLVIAVIVTGFIYPVFGHWAWGGLLEGEPGWLAGLGFVDFAGASVVHTIGGFAALAAVIIIGPRRDRFSSDTSSKRMSSHNLPLSALGAVLLFQGWIGFNGGSALGMNHQVPGIICNTFLAGTAGMATTLLLSRYLNGYVDVLLAINGAIAGLVAITAGCNAFSGGASVLTGVVGAIVMVIADRCLNRLQLDDVIGAFPVHAAAGVWGTCAVALFGDPTILGTGLGQTQQLLVQITGVGTAGILSFGTTFGLLKLLSLVAPLRVSEKAEKYGLNISEHGVMTESLELLMEMESQRQRSDFSEQVSVEGFSEVGDIAIEYNRVLRAVNDKSHEVLQAKHELEETVKELEEFNQLTVGRELRMIELKTEVNELAAALGQDRPYAEDVNSINEKLDIHIPT